MYFNTNETSLQTKEPSRKLLRRSIAAFPVPTETSTEPWITNDSVLFTNDSITNDTLNLSISEPTITDDSEDHMITETTVTSAGQTNVNEGRWSRFLNDRKTTAVDAGSKAADFFSKAWNHKLKYNDWKVYYFIGTIIFTLLAYIANSIQKGDNHYRLNGFTGFSSIKWVCLKILKIQKMMNDEDPEDDDQFKLEERISFWFHIIETLIFLVFPALVLSGYLTCPAIIMNFLMLPIVISAYIISWLISSIGATCGVGLTMIIFAAEAWEIIQMIVDIFRSKFQSKVNIKFPMNMRVFKSDECSYATDNFFFASYRLNIENSRRKATDDGLNIDNSKGYAESFILEIQKVLNDESMLLHYVTKDSMVYSQREDGHLSMEGSSMAESKLVTTQKVTIHGTKVTDNGIERRKLMDYKKHIPYSLMETREREGVWTEIRKQFEQDKNTFDFIPNFTEEIYKFTEEMV